MRIRITINNVTVPIAPGQRVVKEFESNLLNREPDVTEFTYSFKVGLTDDVVKAIGYLHILEIPSFPGSFAGRLIIDDVFVKDVTIFFNKVDTEWRSADINIVGDYGSYGNVVGETKLADLTLGGVRTIGSVVGTFEQTSIPDGIVSRQLKYFKCNTATYMNQLANNLVQDDYVFPMCVDETNPNMTEAGNYNRSIINAYVAEATTGVNRYCDPYEAMIATLFKTPLLGSGVNLDDRYYWVPMFRVAFVLTKCFEEFNFTVVPGSILADFNFIKIILYNTFAINTVSIQETCPSPTLYHCDITATGTKIKPQDHMPDMTVVDFIHEIGKKYNLQFNIDFTAKTVTVDRLYSFPVLAPVIDITQQASKFSVINNTQTDAKWRNGFTLIHDFDGADGTELNQERMDEINTVGWQYAFDSRFAMDSYPSATDGDRAYLRSENAVYDYYDGEWSFVCHNIGRYHSSTLPNKQEITTKVSPITMKTHDIMYLPDEVSTTWLLNFGDTSMFYLKAKMLCPTTNYGICGRDLWAVEDWLAIKVAGGPITNSLRGNYATSIMRIFINPRVMNWLYRQSMNKGQFADKYPFASPGRYDVNGVALVSNAFYQQWYIFNEQEGTYFAWYKPWNDMLRNGIPVDITMEIPDINLYQKLQWNRIILKRGHLKYLIIKTTEVLGFPSVADLQAFLLK